MKARVRLSASSAASSTRSLPDGFYSAFDTDKGVADIEATIKKARELTNGGKVGVVGYCMGGKMAYLAATRTPPDRH